MALPKYNTHEYIAFLNDMRRAGRRVFHYRGDCFWSGPAVKVNKITELHEIVFETRVVTHYEHDGHGFVVHPYIRGQ